MAIYKSSAADKYTVVPQRLIDSRKVYSPTDDEVSKARASGIINREFKTKPFN